MKQILIIHGGNSFPTYNDYIKYLTAKKLNYQKLIHPIGWKERLSDDLLEYDVIYPTMPNSQNAVYEEWKIYFEKLVQLLEGDVQIIGHSLGAMFLAKYLNEFPLPKPVRRILLVAGGYDDETNESLGSFKVRSATGLSRSAQEVHLFHSKDDPVVSFTELAKFQADLPTAISHVFEDRGHFIGETFPELHALLQQK